MTGLRLAFVTRRFWPLVGENELLVASLAAELQQRGHRPTVLTPKYGKYWPTQVCVREVPVVRLPHPPPRTWGNVRYSFAVSRWLQQRQNELDAVVISGPREDALTALGALRSSHVAVIAQDEIGLDADVAPRRFGDQLLRRLRGCDAFVRFGNRLGVDSHPSWLPTEKLHHLSLGVPMPPPQTPASKQAARQSLADVNHDLATAADAPVALCLTPMVADAQLELLARSWRTVQVRWPEARLWIVGDGPTRSSLFTLLSDLNLKYRVVLPGTFDDWEVLLQAADIVVQPAQPSLMGLADVEAMAAGLPVIVYHCEQATTPLEQDWSELAGDGASAAVLHVNRTDGDQLASRLTFLIENPGIAVSIGERARMSVQAERSLKKRMDEYESLLTSLVQSRRSTAGPA